MKTWRIRLEAAIGIAALLGTLVSSAQAPPQFTGIQLLTNKEMAVKLSVDTGSHYRLDVSTNLGAWNPLVTLTGAAVAIQHTDSAAPFLNTRFYRAEKIAATNILGDFLTTTDGDVIIQPRYHATFVMSWNGKMIYNDPAPPATYTGLPKADLILLSHTHGDHLNTGTINAVTNSGAVIIASQTVWNSLTVEQRALTIVLGYGASTNVMGLNVQAVHSYDFSNHPINSGNGYVVTIGGKRIYISGDTTDVPEIRTLPNIDIAFLCMNPTFTMSVNQATNVIRSMRPKVVYPYHYTDSGQTTNAAAFKQRLGTDLGIEVRLRKWY
jgi:L-ascorbate metabolism protein UlaG (beta-lactamase superfamily)